MLLVGKLFGQGFDILGQRQALFNTQRQGLQRLDQFGFGGGAQVATAVTDRGHQHQQASQLGGERLGGGHPNFCPRAGHKGQIRFTHQRGARHVADSQRAHVAGFLGQTQRRQGIGGLAALGEGHQQAVGAHYRFAIAELGGDLHIAGDASDLFEPVASHHAGVIGGAAGDDLDVLYLVKDGARAVAERFDHHVIAAQTPFQGVGDRFGLLVDLLEHVMTVFALVTGIVGELGLLLFAHHGVAVGIEDVHVTAGHFGHITLFQEDETTGHRQQRHLVGGDKVLADTATDHQR